MTTSELRIPSWQGTGPFCHVAEANMELLSQDEEEAGEKTRDWVLRGMLSMGADANDSSCEPEHESCCAAMLGSQARKSCWAIMLGKCWAISLGSHVRQSIWAIMLGNQSGQSC